MKALVYDNALGEGKDGLKLVEDYKNPVMKAGDALIKTTMTGICNTDEEITKGYMGYKGVLGHEFTGIVQDVFNGADKGWIGKRVVGEINAGCKNCKWCASGLERHCPNRGTLGIWQKEGCFSEYFTLPVSNLLEIPGNVTDEEAVFVEPLAAAYEIIEQVHIKPTDRVALLGDGKLGLSIALVLGALNIDLYHIGKHQNKLDISKNAGNKTMLLSEIKGLEGTFDVVIEATGSVGGFETSLSLTKPRGVLVLKSTIAAKEGLNLASVVINEITVVGSRCGQCAPVIRLLEKKAIDVKPLISKILPFDSAVEGFELNRQKDTLKVLLRM